MRLGAHFCDLISGKAKVSAPPPPNPGWATTAAAATTATEEFPQSIQAPSSTHPGISYPVKGKSLTPMSGVCKSCYIYIYICIYIYKNTYIKTYIYVYIYYGICCPLVREGWAWMLWGNSSVVVAAAVAVAHLDLENGHFSSFITESALPECADRSVSSSEYRRLRGYGKLS